MFSKDQVRAAIFENQLPTRKIRPFKKREWFLTLRVVEKAFPQTLEECVELLTSSLVISNKPEEEKEFFLRSLNPFVVNTIFEKYLEVYNEWIKSLNDLVKDIVTNDTQSKFAWEISKHTGINKILRSSKYNNAQLLWIFYNSAKEKKDKSEHITSLIKNVFEMLKPWLDKELFAQMEQTEENRRENVLYEEKTQEYLEEASGDKVEIDYT